jgi:hypothetical protein
MNNLRMYRICEWYIRNHPKYINKIVHKSFHNENEIYYITFLTLTKRLPYEKRNTI